MTSVLNAEQSNAVQCVRYFGLLLTSTSTASTPLRPINTIHKILLFLGKVRVNICIINVVASEFIAITVRPVTKDHSD